LGRMLFHILPFLSLGCKPAEGAGSAQYAGAGTEPETTAFGVFDGCTMTVADEYPAAVYQHRGPDWVPDSYPPDGGTPCSPTGGGPGCYMQTPESIRG